MESVCDAVADGIDVYVLGLDFKKKAEHLAILQNMAACTAHPLYMWGNWTQLPGVVASAMGIVPNAPVPTVTLDANCTDEDSDPVVFGDDFPQFDIDPATGIIVWPLNASAIGTNDVGLTCSDGNLTAYDRFNLSIANVCSPPVARIAPPTAKGPALSDI